MTNSPNSVVRPDVLNENKTTINSFLRESYSQARKQWDDGVSYIQDGMSFLKDEFSSMYDRTGQYLNRMLLPVNNFLKDIPQIDSELRQEISKEPTHLICLDGKMIPIEKALTLPMEENY